MNSLVNIHPTAIVEKGVVFGPGTSVWDNVHIRNGARLGTECIVGEKTYIAYDVVIGNRVKINAFVYICYGVTIEDGVMISAGTIFTNDLYPRACTPDLSQSLPSQPNETTRTTHVGAGATIGAGCVIGSGLRIGRFSMVSMGSVVTRSIDLALGNPAQSVGCVCRCGQRLAKWAPGKPVSHGLLSCQNCGRDYEVTDGIVTECTDINSVVK
jgi:UDP-2-acetamido-3-amino-2,3-dideoxy-glucuronate N-acetyltransferase